MQAKIVRTKISPGELQEIAGDAPDAMAKLVVDIDQGILSMGCELHIDCADQLLEAGSNPAALWGANIYPGDKRIDFVSLLNIRPADNNRSMEIQDPHIRHQVETIIKKLLL